MHETIEQLRRELCEGVAGMSAEETQVPRAEGKWNVQQIVEHLLLSYEATTEVVGVRVAKGTATKAFPSMAQRLGQWMIAGLGVFPKGRAAPEAVCPEETLGRSMPGEELAGRVGDALGRMDAALTGAEGLFGASAAGGEPYRSGADEREAVAAVPSGAWGASFAADCRHEGGRRAIAGCYLE